MYNWHSTPRWKPKGNCRSNSKNCIFLISLEIYNRNHVLKHFHVYCYLYRSHSAKRSLSKITSISALRAKRRKKSNLHWMTMYLENKLSRPYLRISVLLHQMSFWFLRRNLHITDRLPLWKSLRWEKPEKLWNIYHWQTQLILLKTYLSQQATDSCNCYGV